MDQRLESFWTNLRDVTAVPVIEVFTSATLKISYVMYVTVSAESRSNLLRANRSERPNNRFRTWPPLAVYIVCSYFLCVGDWLAGVAVQWDAYTFRRALTARSVQQDGLPWRRVRSVFVWLLLVTSVVGFCCARGGAVAHLLAPDLFSRQQFWEMVID